MKVETDAALVVFWRWAEMVLRWHRPVGNSLETNFGTGLFVHWCTNRLCTNRVCTVQLVYHSSNRKHKTYALRT